MNRFMVKVTQLEYRKAELAIDAHTPDEAENYALAILTEDPSIFKHNTVPPVFEVTQIDAQETTDDE